MEFYRLFKQPFLAEDDGTLGGQGGATDAQAADVQTNDESANDTGVSETGTEDTGDSGAADHSQSNEDNAKYAAARRDAESQAKALKDRQDNFAKQYGYNTFEELEYAQQVNQYAQQNNVDPAIAEMKIKQDRLENMLAMQGRKSQMTEEINKLQNEPYFKEVEPTLRKMLDSNPMLDVEASFAFVRGKMVPEIIKKQTAASNQKLLNNINGKSHIKPDGKSTDNDFTDIDPDEFKMAKTLNPKETLESYRAWKKSQK